MMVSNSLLDLTLDRAGRIIRCLLVQQYTVEERHLMYWFETLIIHLRFHIDMLNATLPILGQIYKYILKNNMKIMAIDHSSMLRIKLIV